MTTVDDGLVVLVDEPLAAHTAWRTGGRCDAFVWIHRQDALLPALDQCRAVGWKWLVLGAGTRTVARDGTLEGAVFRLGTEFARIVEREPGVWDVGAGVPVPAVVARSIAEGRSGVESLAGVPGSIGASILLDPGWDAAVEQVSVVLRGKIREVPLGEVQGRDRVVVGCRLRLAADAPAAVAKRASLALDANKSVPPSSWYQATGRVPLRKVLGSVELPTVRLRRAAIPEWAPELLVNLGEGTAADLELLHKSAMERVKRGRGIELEPRIRWLGARLAVGATGPSEHRSGS